MTPTSRLPTACARPVLRNQAEACTVHQWSDDAGEQRQTVARCKATPPSLPCRATHSKAALLGGGGGCLRYR